MSIQDILVRVLGVAETVAEVANPVAGAVIQTLETTTATATAAGTGTATLPDPVATVVDDAAQVAAAVAPADATVISSWEQRIIAIEQLLEAIALPVLHLQQTHSQLFTVPGAPVGKVQGS